MTEIKQAACIADSSRGIYIPQFFAETHKSDWFKGITAEDWNTLSKGPDAGEDYWETWNEVLDNAETTDGGILHQDGDLWIIWPQRAIDVVNKHVEAQVEYEETHKDSGDAYREAMEGRRHDETFLARVLFDTGVVYDPSDMERVTDAIYDAAVVTPRHQFDSSYTGLGLDGMAVGEVEVSLDELGIDDVTMEQITDSCDAYINNKYAYTPSDIRWCLEISKEGAQEAINDMKG